MKQFFYVALGMLYSLILLPKIVTAQISYTDSLLMWQQTYKQDFITNKHSPLLAEDTAYIYFLPIDESYLVTAKVSLKQQMIPVIMPTSNQKEKSFVPYATLTFVLQDTVYSLEVYSSSSDDQHLFLPFKDASNSNQTYGGGRYLDLKKNEVMDNQIIIDFNKAYNPYCAFSSGYSCPIPPPENYLSIPILVGELQYEGPYRSR